MDTRRVPWAVSLIVSAIVILPQVLLTHYKSSTAVIVIFVILEWLLLAAIFRLVVFLSDRFRRV